MNFEKDIDTETLGLPNIYGLEFKLKNRLLKLVIFAPNLAHFSQIISNILVIGKLSQNTYF
jgi:hypothetical protein